jgi:hypothetical protein
MIPSNVGEEKDFEWVAGQLAASHVFLKVCETIFLQSDEVVSWVYSTAEGRVSRKSPEEEKTRTFGQALEYFYGYRKRENGGKGIISYAMSSGGRASIDDLKYEELISMRSSYSRYHYLQSPSSKATTQQLYLLRLEAKDGLYSSTFSIRKKAGLRPATDLRLYYKMLIPCKLLVEAVQMSRKWRVLVIEIELIVNENGDPWIADTCLCRVQRCSPFPRNYTKKSIALKVQTPINLLKDISISNASEQNDISLEDWLLPVPRRQVVSSHLQAYHPCFKELLARQFAKSQRRIVRNIDELFTEIEEKVLKETENVKKPLLTKRENSLHFDSTLFHTHDPPSIPREKQTPQPMSHFPSPLPLRSKRISKPVRCIRTSSLDRLICTKSHRETRLSRVGSVNRIYRFIKTSHTVK